MWMQCWMYGIMYMKIDFTIEDTTKSIMHIYDYKKRVFIHGPVVNIGSQSTTVMMLSLLSLGDTVDVPSESQAVLQSGSVVLSLHFD